MGVSASEAAKMVGKSVPTIVRAINRQNNALSATKLETGGYDIDPAELWRVFPAPISRETPVTPLTLSDETPNDTRALRVEIEGLRERLADKEDTIADLRRRLDQEAEERRKLTALLTHQPEPSAAEPPAIQPEPVADAPRRRWWQFGAANS